MTGKSGRAPRTAFFFVRTLRQTAGLDSRSPERRLSRPLAPFEARQGKLKEAIDRTRKVLRRAADYRIGIVAGSDTGAVEMALWSLLGPRPVDVLAWESFGEDWVTDVVKQLKLKDARVLKARLWRIARPDADRSRARHRLPLERHDIGRARAQRRLDRGRPRRADDLRCDLGRVRAWTALGKLDVVTFSWQKVLGGEGRARHAGALARAPLRGSKAYTPPWPLPKIFRMTKDGKLVEGIFEGETINTPSMLVRRGLSRRAEMGGRHRRAAGVDRARRRAISRRSRSGCKRTDWVDFLAARSATRAPTPRCA